MSLKARISEMSDSGQFEDLATDILRWSDPMYESVLQTGVNIEGKPVRDPVDGLGQAPDTDPPHYVFLEFTTYQKSRLERKWLATPDPGSDQSKGDLIKAAEQAKKIQKDIPDAEFTAVLVSNRVLGSDLVRAAWGTANDFDISIDIWDVGRLSDFLQTDPDGQYIRKKHFGIEEERLSEPLLLELSDKSLKFYRENFHILVDEVKVERPELATILDRTRSSGTSTYFIPIVGNSGFGKTVTCYQVMEQWRADKKPALRLDSDDIEDSKSLAQAIQSGLTDLQASLDSTAGRTALQLSQDNYQLLIAVDDLNRANNPSRLLARLRNWMGGAREEATNDSDGFPITILCPLWPRIWSNQEREISQNQFAEPIELGPFSTENAVRLIQSYADTQGRDVDEAKARELAEKIGRDPHLIGLLGRLIQAKEPIEDLPNTSKNVLKRYTENAYETASGAADEPLIVPDYERAVEEMSLNVMEERNMTPTWRQVYEWSQSGSDNLDELRELTRQAQLLTILDQKSDRILSFRHDRIRDFLLSNASLGKIERTDKIPSFLNDPYYHSILGTGIAYFRPSETTLSKLCASNPLALLEALHELGGDAPEYEKKVSAEFQQWVDEQGGYEDLPNSFLGVAMNLLRETDSNQVLDIAELLPQLPPVLLARFRNGDLEAGIQYYNSDMIGSPNTNDPQRNSVFDAARQRWEDQYTDVLSDVISSIGTDYVQGAVRLAGFLGRTELCSGLEDCWEKHQNNPEFLPAFLWAVFQCGIPEHRSLVDQVFSQWASLPSASSVDDESDELIKGDIFSDIKFSITRDISDAQIEYLIEAVEAFPDLEYHLSLFLHRISDPNALELVVRIRGENIQETDGMSHWAMRLLDPWEPDSPRGQTLPPEGKERMHEIWSDDSNIDQVRRGAFLLWARNAQAGDIEELKQASKINIFSYTACHYRLKLGDETVITSSSLDFVENPRLLDVLSSAWSPEAYALVNDLLYQHTPDESRDLFYHLGELLFRIPPEEAEKLLKIHWEKISGRPKFFQAALYSATSDARELAARTYEESDNPEALLNRVKINFGFNTYGRSELISRKHLVSLEPYLGDIQDSDLIGIAEKVNELGMEDWGVQHIQPVMSEEFRQQHYPTDEDILREIDDIRDSEDVEREIGGWMMRFDRRAISKSRVLQILGEWLQEDPTVVGYQMVAKVVKKWGTRDDLSMLNEVLLQDDRVQQFYKDAEFGVKIRTL